MPKASVETPDWLRQMESILEELNEGVIIIDNQLNVVFANETLTRLVQYEREEIQGHRPDAIFPPEDIPNLLRQHELRQRYGRNRQEFYLPRKDGQKIPVIFSGRTVRGPDGQEYGLVTVTDISEQKRIEEQLRERQREIDAELSIAERVQQSLAPRSLVWNNLAVEAYYSPARTIGGDFGIVLPQSDEFLDVIVCDVSGHGVGSALMANRIYSETLHALERTSQPANLLQRLHAFVHDRIAQDSFFFTMSTARFHQSGRRMTFAAAGQPPAMLVSNGVVRLLDSQSGILGCLSEVAPVKSMDEIELARGDRLVLYTDGLVEVFNSLGDMLGVEGLERSVLQSAGRPIRELRQAIVDAVVAWRGGPLADDVSLVIVEVF